MTTMKKKIGWIAAAVSVVTLLAPGILGVPKTYRAILAFPWFYGGCVLLSVAGSVIAGRLLSPRWYYVTLFWIADGIMAAFVIWYY